VTSITRRRDGLDGFTFWANGERRWSQKSVSPSALSKGSSGSPSGSFRPFFVVYFIFAEDPSSFSHYRVLGLSADPTRVGLLIPSLRTFKGARPFLRHGSQRLNHKPWEGDKFTIREWLESQSPFSRIIIPR